MNIYDIAELSGVSIATVSRVVNDSPKVSEKTKMKVRAVMEANNYTPNVFARGLGLNSMKTVGIVCPDVSDDYMAGSVAYLEKRLRSYGYDCILYCSGYEYEDKAAAVHLILQKRIDALFLYDSNSYSTMEKMRGYEDALRDNGLSVTEEQKIFVQNKILTVRDMLLEKDVCCEPELSSIDSRSETLCKTAVDSMIALLKGRPVRHKKVVPCRLVKRHTTNF